LNEETALFYLTKHAYVVYSTILVGIIGDI